MLTKVVLVNRCFLQDLEPPQHLQLQLENLLRLLNNRDLLRPLNQDLHQQLNQDLHLQLSLNQLQQQLNRGPRPSQLAQHPSQMELMRLILRILTTKTIGYRSPILRRESQNSTRRERMQ